MRRVLMMSSSGFASSTMKLASLPAAMVPSLSRCRSRAFVLVAATIASRGHAALRVGRDLLVGAEAVAGPVGAEPDHHAGIVDLSQVAAVELEELDPAVFPVGFRSARAPDASARSGWPAASRPATRRRLRLPGPGMFGPVQPSGAPSRARGIPRRRRGRGPCARSRRCRP